jgi:endonuclease YncB( thermonuclease family)
MAAAVLALGVMVTASACSSPNSSERSGTPVEVAGLNGPGQELPSSGLVARVLDGVTIEVESEGATFQVRYMGVAVPDGMDSEGALEFNRFLVEGKSVSMIDGAVDADASGIPLRYVYSDGEMVNLKLLVSGWARLAEFPPSFEFLDEFSQAENSAKTDGRGLWKGATSHDSDGHAPTAPAVTTAAVPAFSGGTLPMPPGSDSSGLCDYSGTSEPIIKGNIDRRTSEHEYHVPGGLFYSTTVIEPSDGEFWFCTEADALSLGWKRSKY